MTRVPLVVRGFLPNLLQPAPGGDMTRLAAFPPFPN